MVMSLGFWLFLNKLQNLDDTLGGQRRQERDKREIRSVTAKRVSKKLLKHFEFLDAL